MFKVVFDIIYIISTDRVDYLTPLRAHARHGVITMIENIVYLWAILLHSVAYSSGAVTYLDPMQFSLTADPSVFNLTCVSYGGPPTVTWTRDGNNVPYDATHVLTQTVTDQLNIVYSNVLTVTGSESGNYTCSVSNDRTASPLESAPLTVVGE